MIDLTACAEPIRHHFLESLKEFAARSGPAQSVFYHTHPEHGQNHLYFSLDAGDRLDDILGKPIDAVINFPAWEEEMESADEEGYERRIKLADGSIVDVPDWSEWNRIIASFCNDLIKDLMSTLDASLVPKRVGVCAEYGQFEETWSPADLPGTSG